MLRSVGRGGVFRIRFSPFIWIGFCCIGFQVVDVFSGPIGVWCCSEYAQEHLIVISLNV